MKTTVSIILICLFFGCNTKSEKQEEVEDSPVNNTYHYTSNYNNGGKDESSSSYRSEGYDESSTSYQSEGYESKEGDDNEEEEVVNQDGTHEATVNYYNPATGFSNTYT
jgi:hypothetical protein